MDTSARIYIAGHRGLVGAALLRLCRQAGYTHLVTRTRAQLDLTDGRAVARFFKAEKPDFVLMAAAKVGGIHANATYPADFIYQNLMIQSHVIHQSFLSGVKRMIFLGSSCIYPKHAPQPITEDRLMTGALEPTNSAYAVAKIAGIEMCWSYNRQHHTGFLPVMPTNLYGPGDNFDLETSHVLPALIRKFHLAKLADQNDSAAIEADQARFGPIPPDFQRSLSLHPPQVGLWGTGTSRRELLYVDDLASACLFLMNLDDNGFYGLFSSENKPLINIGVGSDHTIRQLSVIVAKTVGFTGKVIFDPEKSDGTPRKLLDVSRLTRLGWKPRVTLEDGIRATYRWYRAQTS